MEQTVFSIRLRVRLFMGKVRRQFMIFFMRKYIDRQLKIRQGECLQCAACCNFSYPCPLLKEINSCSIYNTCRPRVCSFFPINQADLNDVAACGYICGYRFE